MGESLLEEIVQDRESWLKSKGFDPESLQDKWKLTYSPLETMQNNYNYVTLELGIKKDVFERFPTLFGYSTEDNLKPKVKYITEELRLPLKVFERFPALFSYSIEDNLKPKVKYITEELDLDAKVFEKNPQLFNLSIEDNLKLKYHYLTTEMHTNNFALEKFPVAFSLSLKKRIIPRWEFAKTKGKSNITLSNLLSPNDKNFAKKMGSDTAHYHQFRDNLNDFIEETYASLVTVVTSP